MLLQHVLLDLCLAEDPVSMGLETRVPDLLGIKIGPVERAFDFPYVHNAQCHLLLDVITNH